MTGSPIATHNPRQDPCEVAVVVPTILRPSLLRAVRSVFSQDLGGRIHLLIGIDVRTGPDELIGVLRAECPDHVMMTVVDPGYSTSQRHGGLHSNHFGGSLRTVLSYLANSRYVAYLDDNDWYAGDHLSGLRMAIEGHDWAFSYRWLVDPETEWPICRDEWDSVGPGRGINRERFGGFVQPSGLMLDKLACHKVLTFWSMAAFPDGSGEDRLIFHALSRQHAWATSGRYSCYCILNSDAIRDDHHTREFKARGLHWVEDRSLVAEALRCLDAAWESHATGRFAETAGLCERALAINPYLPEAMELMQALKQPSPSPSPAGGGDITAPPLR